MAIDYDRLKARPFADIRQEWDWCFSARYALGLGLCGDPLSEMELRYVYEKNMLALPTMAVVLGHPGFFIADPDTGIDHRKVLHGEHSLTIHRPLAAEGKLVARNSVDEIIDKGEGRGAILNVRRDLFDEASGELQSTQITSMFCRSDGGFGGPRIEVPKSVDIPMRAPDLSVTRATLPQMALIYRLSGDYNPLHAEPAEARQSGFDRPILHGLATYGVAGFSVISACADGNGDALRHLACRFTAPVYPGETLRTDIWMEVGNALFRCTALERDVVVLDKGEARFA